MMRSITYLTHLLLSDYLKSDAIAVDMTLGNGYDTLFLASRVKHVFAYDIQEIAINNSKKLLSENKINNVTFINDTNENIDMLNQKYSIAMFNLGYLPGANKNITTNSNATINAIKKVLRNPFLEVVSIVVYEGHPQGLKESEEIQNFIKNISGNFNVKILKNINTKRISPYLVLIERRKTHEKNSINIS